MSCVPSLKPITAKRVFDLLDQSDISFWEASIEQQKIHTAAGRIKEFMDEDSAFHRHILEKKRNEEILSTMNGLYDRAYMLGITNTKGMRSARSIEEHE